MDSSELLSILRQIQDALAKPNAGPLPEKPKSASVPEAAPAELLEGEVAVDMEQEETASVQEALEVQKEAKEKRQKAVEEASKSVEAGARPVATPARSENEVLEKLRKLREQPHVKFSKSDLVVSQAEAPMAPMEVSGVSATKPSSATCPPTPAPSAPNPPEPPVINSATHKREYMRLESCPLLRFVEHLKPCKHGKIRMSCSD